MHASLWQAAAQNASGVGRAEYRSDCLATSHLQLGLAAVIVAQAAHSVEECIGRMWESHPLARFLAGAISSDLARGFIIANVLIVGFGIWCVLWPVRRQWPVAVSLGWFWLILESINAIGHSLWSLFSGRYTPGLATVPILIVSAGYLALQLRRAHQA
jgi:hypothetical protein